MTRPLLDYQLWQHRADFAEGDEARLAHAVARHLDAADRITGSPQDVSCAVLAVLMHRLFRDHDRREIEHAIALAIDAEAREAAACHADAMLRRVMEVGT